MKDDDVVLRSTDRVRQGQSYHDKSTMDIMDVMDVAQRDYLGQPAGRRYIRYANGQRASQWESVRKLSDADKIAIGLR